ncbi:MAG: hypothetical protein K0S27_1664 [Gammaproteobacteria bacterium]|nr:hypothetical protein [Gammaproteobacteria bacterium]
MQDSQEKTESSSHEGNEAVDKKQYLISDEKFSLIRKCQQIILESTESSPSIRKIINELITEENLQKITSKFIEVWKC